jgi:hypothetical protein
MATPLVHNPTWYDRNTQYKKYFDKIISTIYYPFLDKIGSYQYQFFRLSSLLKKKAEILQHKTRWHNVLQEMIQQRREQIDIYIKQAIILLEKIGHMEEEPILSILFDGSQYILRTQTMKITVYD